MTPAAIIRDFGDSCLVLELEARIEPAINDRCVAVARLVRQAGLCGVRDVVATYHTVAVHVDPLLADRDAVGDSLRQALGVAADGERPRGRPHEIPVCYGEDLGPDLPDVARFAGCSEDEVVRLHAEPEYRVYMMGFLPGFPYLGRVHEQIRMPRHDVPRVRVAAGSVAIAGFQTGVYPQDGPGGWRVIGRTWVKPFDLSRQEPLLFDVGDTIRFVPVSRAEYSRARGTGL